MLKPRPVKLNIPTEPMFSFTPCGDGWRIDMASYMAPGGDSLRVAYLEQSDNWTLPQVSTLVDMLTEAINHYQEYLTEEQDREVCSEVCSEAEQEAQQTANYRVKCVGCGAEMVLALGPGDREEEEGNHAPVPSGG